MTRVLGISSSPRAGGNTDLLLDEVLRGAQGAGAETEKMTLKGLSISPCRGCGGCERTGECVVRDDMYIFYEKFLEEFKSIYFREEIRFAQLDALLVMAHKFLGEWLINHIKVEDQKFAVYIKGQSK